MKNLNILAALGAGLLSSVSFWAGAESLRPMEAMTIARNEAVPYKMGVCRKTVASNEAKQGVTPDESVNGDETYLVPPEGNDILNLYRSGEAYYLDWFGGVAFGRIDGEMSSVVVTGDEVWIYNPFGKSITRTWIKGSLDADGNVEVQTPQCVSVAYDNVSGEEILMYLVNMQLEVAPDGVSATYVENKEESVIRYQWDGSALTLVEGQLGMCFWMPDTDDKAEEEWMWFGVADLKQRFEPCPYTPVTPPANIQYENYTIASYDYTSSEKQGDIVQVGFDEDDNVWIKNLHKILTGFYVKGEKTDSGYVFKTQYLGPVEQVGTHAFFLPGYYTYVDDVKAVGSLEEIVMDFDRESRTLHCPSDTLSWFINCGKGDIRFLQCNENPTLSPYREKEEIVLTNPVITGYQAADVENKTAGYLSFTLSSFDPEGDYIDTRCMTYNIMIDGIPMVFEPDVYLDLQEPLTDIPFGLSNYDITTSGPRRMVYLYSDDFEKIGVRLNYAKGDKKVSSDIVEVDASGVGDVYAEKDIRETVYMDLLGRKVARPSKGIYVRTTTYSDGTVRSEKVAVSR